MNKLRGYFWKDHVDADCGIAIVANNIKEAKRLGFNWFAREVGIEDETFISQRCTWAKDADIEGLSVGEVDSVDGLRRGLYGWTEDVCDKCKKMRTLWQHKVNDESFAYCDKCIQESEQ